LATPLSLPIPASSGLIAWLHALGIALAFTTYRANRLIFLGTAEPAGEPAEPASGSAEPNQPTGAPQLKLHERLFDRPMGLFVAGESLWMAARCQIWRLDNLLGPGQLHEGGDRLYVPAISFTTGDVNAHELVLGADGQPIFVNTAFSCLATLAPGCSFAPTWAPPFITKLAGDDRCHLNGLALKDGIPTWASACGGSGEPSAWRNNRSGGGVLIHIPSGELAATGLSMPHSPRWHDGKLWLLNSGTGELGWIEEGRFHSLCALPGFVRGLAFASGCAVVGLSKLRYPVLAEPFAALDADRFGFLMAGTLPQYLDWLEGLDIGLAPLLPTEFNRCRSDVKFLEYASRSLVPVLQNLDPYRHLAGSGAALLFGDPDDLIRQLDRLVAEPELRQSIASTAHALVGRERQLAQHAPERLAVYRELAESTTPAEGTAGPLLQQAAERPLTALPGLQQLAPAHWRLGVDSPADQQRLLGVDALQRGALAVAAEALAEAARLDPSDAHAHSFLGHALQRQGRPLDALAAFEQAASLDPLQSRPVRALARLHARAARHYAERAATLNPIDDLPQEPEGVERP
jgi:uncharacterized protein (TIGR03032 family)